MTFAKKVIVAVELSDKLSELIKPLKEMDFLEDSEIHFVYVFNTISYAFGIGDVPLVYPIEADRKFIEQSAMALLTEVTEKILPEKFKGKVIHQVLFHSDPKEHFSQYVNEQMADLVIVPTRRKHGLFESSFAQYVNKHTECNMIFLKQK